MFFFLSRTNSRPFCGKWIHQFLNMEQNNKRFMLPTFNLIYHHLLVGKSTKPETSGALRFLLSSSERQTYTCDVNSDGFIWMA